MNAARRRKFGEFEYWFAMIKVVAIVAFIGFGVVVLARPGASAPSPAFRISRLAEDFSRTGFRHLDGDVLRIFSYIGTEVVAVTAGEAEKPDEAVPRAMRTMVFG